MKGLCRAGFVILLALVFGALPFAAADNLSCGVASAAAPVWMARPGGGGGGVSAQTTYCEVSCGNGTSVSTTCQGSCYTSDTNCPYLDGYVGCNGVLTSCPGECPAGPYCAELDGTSCSNPQGPMNCTTSDRNTYTCNCFLGHWSCPY